MTVNTKGFVVTPRKPVFFVLALLERSINALIGTMREVREANQGLPENALHSRRVDIHISAELGMAQLRFTHQGDARVLSVFFDCDCDHVDVAPQSISLSMGASGQAELYVQTALKALRALGPVYYCACDAGSEDWVQLDLEPLTFCQAAEQRLVSASPYAMDKWLRAVADVTPQTADEPTLRQVLGMSSEQVSRARTLESDQVCDYLKKLATARAQAS